MLDNKQRIKIAMIKKRLTVRQAAKICGYTVYSMQAYLAPSRVDKMPSDDKVMRVESHGTAL